MRPIERNEGSRYQVTISAIARPQLDALSSRTASRVYRQLDNLAELAELSPVLTTSTLIRRGIHHPASLCFQVGTLVGLYDVNRRERRLTLLELLGADRRVARRPA